MFYIKEPTTLWRDIDWMNNQFLSFLILSLSFLPYFSLCFYLSPSFLHSVVTKIASSNSRVWQSAIRANVWAVGDAGLLGNWRWLVGSSIQESEAYRVINPGNWKLTLKGWEVAGGSSLWESGANRRTNEGGELQSDAVWARLGVKARQTQ